MINGVLLPNCKENGVPPPPKKKVVYSFKHSPSMTNVINVCSKTALTTEKATYFRHFLVTALSKSLSVAHDI